MAASQLIIFSIKQASNAHARLSLFLSLLSSERGVVQSSRFKRSNAIVPLTPTGTVHLIVPSGFKVLQTLKRDPSYSYLCDYGQGLYSLRGFKRSNAILPISTWSWQSFPGSRNSASNAHTR